MAPPKPTAQLVGALGFPQFVHPANGIVVQGLNNQLRPFQPEANPRFRRNRTTCCCALAYCRRERLNLTREPPISKPAFQVLFQSFMGIVVQLDGATPLFLGDRHLTLSLGLDLVESLSFCGDNDARTGTR